MDGGYVDYYCERTAPGLLGEPLNAVTNLAFIVAAVLLWRMARRAGTTRDPLVWLPIGLLFLTGLGSLALHTTAHPIGGAVDTLALSLCLLATVYAGARRWLGWSPLLAMGWPVGMIAASVATGWLVPVAGAAYLGAFLTAIAMAVALCRRDHGASWWVAGAAAVFVPSFILRALDQPFCGEIPTGTHFAWHLLNACVLYLAIRPLAVRT